MKLQNEFELVYPEQAIQGFDLDIEEAASIASANMFRDWQMRNGHLEGGNADSHVQMPSTQIEH